MKKACVFFTAVIFIAATSLADVLYCEDEVQTTEGSVVGLEVLDHAACAWKGIPFAAPPIGALRSTVGARPWRNPGTGPGGQADGSAEGTPASHRASRSRSCTRPAADPAG